MSDSGVVPRPDALGEVATLLREGVDTVLGRLAQQRIGLPDELGPFGVVEVLRRCRDGVDVTRRDAAAGEGVFEPGDRRADLFATCSRGRFLARGSAVVGQRRPRIGRPPVGGECPLAACGSNEASVAPGLEIGHVSHERVDVIGFQHVGVGVANQPVRIIWRMSHGASHHRLSGGEVGQAIISNVCSTINPPREIGCPRVLDQRGPTQLSRRSHGSGHAGDVLACGGGVDA